MNFVHHASPILSSSDSLCVSNTRALTIYHKFRRYKNVKLFHHFGGDGGWWNHNLFIMPWMSQSRRRWTKVQTETTAKIIPQTCTFWAGFNFFGSLSFGRSVPARMLIYKISNILYLHYGTLFSRKHTNKWRIRSESYHKRKFIDVLHNSIWYSYYR